MIKFSASGPAFRSTGNRNPDRSGYRYAQTVRGPIQPPKFRLFGWLRR